MTRMNPILLILAAASVAAFGLACTSQENANAKAEARDAGQKIEKAAEKTVDAAKELAQDVKREAEPTARKIGQEAKAAGKTAVDVADAQKQALDIRAALMADSSVDASGIDVDVDAKTNTIHITGTVPTAAQKTAVSRMAKDKAAGYTIHNMLTVGTKTTSR